MPDHAPPPAPSLATSLSHLGRAGTHAEGFVNPGVVRGSTMLYGSCDDRRALAPQKLGRGPLYGTAGGPTHHALEDVVAAIEGGTRCQIVSTGLSAVTDAAVRLPGRRRPSADAGFSVLRAGPRVLPTPFLARFGRDDRPITTRRSTPAGIDAAVRRRLPSVLYTESPGSQTFEVQDIPALAEVAHARGANGA